VPGDLPGVSINEAPPEQEVTVMGTITSRSRKWVVTAAAALGIAAGTAGISAAATGSSATPSSTPAAATASAPDPATLSHGPGESVLSGTAAEKVRAAALSAVPGGSIVRVETDSGGAAYEAHVTRSDGSVVTVKLDSSFSVTATQDGFGSGGPRP
jgi:hypothetical protein